ncbi:amino acid adenylation domain-containing protein [Parapusillimonas sp. JC17]|uniref:amino acid adenylation domain-containing protein n=1 Tax=Parapusillimonas sp. JC17 TaxID=3445768 RepID=UPI003FA07954
MSSGYIAAASFAQRQLRYLDLLQPGKSDYAVPFLVEISGPVHEDALRAAFQAVIQRHDSLRASFPLIDDTPCQAVRDDVHIALDTATLPAATPQAWRDELGAAMSALAACPFDLEHGPVLRARLYRPDHAETAECAFALAVVFHHAVADGSSLPVFLADLVQAYDAARAGSNPEWMELPLQYPDYADWEQEQFGAPDSPALADALGYWREQLHDAPSPLELPLDRPRSAQTAHGAGASVRLVLPAAVGTALAEAARQRGATPFIAFLSVFFAVLHRWSGLEDLLVTVPVSKRTRPELAGLVGLLVDTLPLRVPCTADTRYDALLDGVRSAFREALRHRDVPFQRIVQSIDIERRSGAMPLMQVLFGSLESDTAPLAARDGACFRVLDDQTEQAAKSDLSFVYRQTDEHLELWCRYEPALFDRSTVENLLSWFGTLAQAVALAPDECVADLPLIGEAEGCALIQRFNATARPYPAEKSVMQLFDEIALQYADRPAIEEGEEHSSYAQLRAASARLATALVRAGIGPGDPVVLVLSPSTRFLMLVLAILRTGAVYVPLDPAHPHAHRQRLAKSIGARAVILAAGDDGNYGETQVLDASTLEADAAGLPELPAHPATPDATAYIMFTSGSTGEPKGVAVPHRAIIRLVRNTDYTRFGPETRAAIYSNPAFDASTVETWGPLLNGGTAVVIERAAMLDIALLRRVLTDHAISYFWITTGLFHEMAAIDPTVFAGPRTVMTGGDTTSADLVRAVRDACAGSGLKLLHAYGPTENTTFSTCFDADDLGPRDAIIPIGPPIANSTAYVLDRRGKPLPVGVNGEIVVGGDGIAQGYVGDPQRTASSFLPDPFLNEGRLMYRTGDFGRWRPDGALLFAGRSDDQVKVRGFRIELNEIAAALGRHPDLRTVYVAAPRQDKAERQIIAYVVPDRMPGPSPTELRQFLQSRLPPHMLPHAYVTAPALKLNLNGKVDRKALPPVEDHHYDRSGLLIEPRSEEESSLHALWKELLGLDAIGVTENFFHIGGDSILAIRMAARASKSGLPITPSDVFQLQTIERLAELAGALRPRQRRSADRVFPAELLPEADNPEKSSAFLIASLVLEDQISAVELALAVHRLADRHDALRLRWVHDGQAKHIEIAAYVGRLPIRMVEAPDLPDAKLDAWIDEHAARIGRGLDTRHGVTLATTLVDRGPAMPPVIVVALHPGVADYAGAALLLTELHTTLTNGAAALPALDDAPTYADWLSWLETHADLQAAGPGLAALETAGMRGASLPVQRGATAGTLPIVAEQWLDPTLGARLYHHVPARLAVAPLDVLASALVSAVQSSDARGALLIEAIDTERRLPLDAPDTARLIGKMDGVLPILVAPGAGTPAERLQAVKSARQAVAATAPVYRTLGQTFDLPASALGLAWPAPSPAQAIRMHTAPGFGPSVKSALLAQLSDRGLKLAWTGDEPPGGPAALLERIAHALEEIAAFADRENRPLYTASDFPLVDLPGDELAALLASAEDVQDVYPLSPMQEAMLVHTLAASGSGVNFEQSCMRIRGPLDHEAFRHAWATVFERHDVLRTAFHWRGLSRPMQVVHRDVPLPLSTETWPRFDADRLQMFLAVDQARGFELERAPLVRMTLIQVAPDDVYLVSSFHHLLIDGWCLGKLEREVRAAYESHLNRRAPVFDAPIPYRDYIAWLQRSDQTDGRRFFAEMLRELPERRALFMPPTAVARGFTTQRRTLDKEASRALLAFARRRGLTLASVMHFAWAVWLSARLGAQDVVFGTTVSGRPASIPGVENIVGMFINNLPVRVRVPQDATPARLLADVQALLGQLQQHAHLAPAEVAAIAGKQGQAGALFDTLVLVENLASGTSAWSGAEALTVESIHSRLKTAYDLTFIAIPGESIALSVVQPDDGRQLEDGEALLASIAELLVALPEHADSPLERLPRPDERPAHGGERNSPVLPLHFATRPRSTLEACIADAVAGILDNAPAMASGPSATLDTDFWQLGLNSLGLTQLALRLEESLERRVPISLLLEHRCVAALAQALASGQSWTPIVPMNRSNDGRSTDPSLPPFVCVHPVAGDVSVFLELARAMPASIPFWAIQAPGLEQGQEPLRSIEDMAACNLRALAERGMPQPRWLGGYSFGGLVAFEMARQLASAGTPPERVVLIDTPAPLERVSILAPDPDHAHAQWLARMAEVRARFQGVQPVLSRDDLLPLAPADRYAFAAARLHDAALLPPAADADWLARAHRTSLAQYEAYLSYRPPVHAHPDIALALVRADAPRDADLGDMENRQLAIPDMGWRAFSALPVELRYVAGDHVTMLAGDSAREVAAAIAGVRPRTGSDPKP